jgi:hypothetical protein
MVKMKMQYAATAVAMNLPDPGGMFCVDTAAMGSSFSNGLLTLAVPYTGMSQIP